MPTIPDAPFSMVANSALPMTATSTILAAFITPAVAAATIHYVLIAALSKAENTYIDVLQMGLLSVTETEALYTYVRSLSISRLSTGVLNSFFQLSVSLQRKVSAIHVATMRDSLSWWAGLRALLKGRTLTVLSCIHEVQGFETHIKVIYQCLHFTQFNPHFRFQDIEGSPPAPEQFKPALHTGSFPGPSPTLPWGRPWSCLLVIHCCIWRD
ncbi:hypothetical protein B0H13DRAFT_2161690 [Mycena leptocephala]|nr:hypothetical protein B0H13DRAFT_2161690 [Mycena leptocephala]